MSAFQFNEVVDVTIKGVRVVGEDEQTGNLTVAVENGDAYPMPPQAAIERVAPAEWPPKPGDLWKDRDGLLHFAAAYSPDYDDAEDSCGINSAGWRVVLLSQSSDESCTPGHNMHRPETLIRGVGPLTLVHREAAKAAYCAGGECGHHEQLHHGNQCIGGNANDDPCRCTRFQAADGEPDEPTEDAAPTYPTPGSEVPGMPGYVVGKCGHRVEASEWRAGFRVCERCPYPDTTGARATAPDSCEPASAELIRQAARYLRSPATTVEDQAVRLERLAEAAPLLAALLEVDAGRWDAVRIAGATPPGDEALAVARALIGGEPCSAS